MRNHELTPLDHRELRRCYEQVIAALDDLHIGAVKAAGHHVYELDRAREEIARLREESERQQRIIDNLHKQIALLLNEPVIASGPLVRAQP